MKRMLINATQQEELRVALVDGQRLYDLDIECTGHEQKKANIYKGKITRIEPSLEAAFVDYGPERNGFLPLKEIVREYFPANYASHGRPNIKDVLREGQEVIVQIDKEERGNKGAALTTFISLAGSYLVLMPNNPRAGGISRRIEGDDRTELKEALSSLELPDGMGLIVRTGGVGKSAEALQWDLSFRLKHWEAIQKAAENRPAPFLIHQESNVIVRAFRDYLRQDIGEILIDHPKVLELARHHIAALGRPDFSSKIKLYTGEIPLFSHYQIESQIESAFQREVRLPSGGSIVIDTTEALTAIDTNSARATRGGDIEETAFNTNLEAADEIARQLRLRDLGGLIVIDFIDMTPVRHQRAVENRLRGAVRQDRARIQSSHISRFGLLEMSRQRLSPSLGESSHHVCPRCSGTGTIRDNESLSLSILRLIEEEALKENTKEVHAIVPVPIASYLLNEKRDAVSGIEKRQGGVRTIIVPNDQMETPHYSVLRVRKGEETQTLSYMLANLHEEEMPMPSDEEYTERKRPEQPALATFVMPEVPPAPQETTAVQPAAMAAKPSAAKPKANVAEQPGLVSRFFSALKKFFAGDNAAAEVKEVKEEKAAGSDNQRQDQDRRNNNRRARGERNDRNNRDRDNRDNRNNRDDRNNEGREARESCEGREDTRRNGQQNAESREARRNVVTAIDDAEKQQKSRDEQQPRRERNHRRSDEKRQAQQAVKALQKDNVFEQAAAQEERTQVMQRRKTRHLSQKVRVELADAPAVEETQVARVSTEVATIPFPAIVETPVTAEQQDEYAENRDTAGMPRRARRSPRHLRVSGQRHRRYRDERYPAVSPMPLATACASPELALGKVFITYPIVHPHEQVAQEEIFQTYEEVQHINVAEAAAVEAVAPVADVQISEPLQAEKIVIVPLEVETTHSGVIEAPVTEQTQLISAADEVVAEETVEQAEPAQEDAQPVPEIAEVNEPAPVSEEAPAVEEAPVEVVEEVKPVVEAASAVESEPVKQAVKAETAVAIKHATAPMTCAPAPAYTPEAPRNSEWVRPSFEFSGKSSAGGHSASHQATAPAMRPPEAE